MVINCKIPNLLNSIIGRFCKLYRMSLSHFQATCCGHPSFGEMTGYMTEKESRRDRMETSKTRRSPSMQPPYGGMEFSRTSLQQHKNCITGASFYILQTGGLSTENSLHKTTGRPGRRRTDDPKPASRIEKQTRKRPEQTVRLHHQPVNPV